MFRKVIKQCVDLSTDIRNAVFVRVDAARIRRNGVTQKRDIVGKRAESIDGTQAMQVELAG